MLSVKTCACNHALTWDGIVLPDPAADRRYRRKRNWLLASYFGGMLLMIGAALVSLSNPRLAGFLAGLALPAGLAWGYLFSLWEHTERSQYRTRQKYCKPLNIVIAFDDRNRLIVMKTDDLNRVATPRGERQKWLYTWADGSISLVHPDLPRMFLDLRNNPRDTDEFGFVAIRLKDSEEDLHLIVASVAGATFTLRDCSGGEDPEDNGWLAFHLRDLPSVLRSLEGCTSITEYHQKDSSSVKSEKDVREVAV